MSREHPPQQLHQDQQPTPPPAATTPIILRCNIFVSGRVQGVFYRNHTRRAAQARGVRGWVRNLPDGRVEVMAEGSRAAVDDLVKWCHVGSPKSRVDAVDATVVAEGDAYTFATFEVRR
ncbi:acylphosphatase [Trypanosoma grayi]|uniref:acylphosphatase n=1 Tax=Trypanosoma grayi TaxID=71804 RepID=UPI0004F415B9|nr:acylphosphatase [Trypanosoma grayi]KEG11301.1 acylphosphatase [Trypanosoma grayi]